MCSGVGPAALPSTLPASLSSCSFFLCPLVPLSSSRTFHSHSPLKLIKKKKKHNHCLNVSVAASQRGSRLSPTAGWETESAARPLPVLSSLFCQASVSVFQQLRGLSEELSASLNQVLKAGECLATWMSFFISVRSFRLSLNQLFPVRPASCAPPGLRQLTHDRFFKTGRHNKRPRLTVAVRELVRLTLICFVTPPHSFISLFFFFCFRFWEKILRSFITFKEIFH